MLNNTLNTNEVKDRAGSAISFTRRLTESTRTEFAKTGETPSQPLRLSISHAEIGSGIKKRRRSVVRIDRTSMSQVDTTLPVSTAAYLVIDTPSGAMTDNTVLTDVIANVLSFCATTGAASTVLFDGTGNGAKALIEGSL